MFGGFNKTNAAAPGGLATSGLGGFPTANNANPPATGGWGVTPNAGGGAAPMQGFGGPVPQTGGFNSAPMGGFGTQPQQQQGFAGNPQQSMLPPQSNQPFTFLPDYNKQSAIANYLYSMDHAYNALNAKCKFRTFVYNRCDYNQSTALVEKQRYVNFLNGGEEYDSEWYAPMFQNPNPSELYPHVLHFSQELQKRTERQENAVKELTKQAEELVKRLDTIISMNETNDIVTKELRQENVLMRHRWYRILQKVEMLRRRGIPMGEEELLAQRAQQLRVDLLAPCRFTSALNDIEPRIAERAAQVAQYVARREEKETFSSEVTPTTTQQWEKILCDNQVAIERLSKIVLKDTTDVRAMLDRT